MYKKRVMTRNEIKDRQINDFDKNNYCMKVLYAEKV